MTQKRQPKGTKDGGKFAPDVHQESTVVLEARGHQTDSDDAAYAPEKAVMKIGQRVSRDGVTGTVIDVLPVKNGHTLDSCLDPDTFDVQVDWPNEDGEENEPSDCPWYDVSELEVMSEDEPDAGAISRAIRKHFTPGVLGDDPDNEDDDGDVPFDGIRTDFSDEDASLLRG